MEANQKITILLPFGTSRDLTIGIYEGKSLILSKMR